jgi:antitoxin ChpS
MTQISIRQSGGANIVSIPKAILSMLDLHLGSSLDLRIENNRIMLSPTAQEPTLEELLAGSPKKNLVLTDDDKEWLEDAPIGKGSNGLCARSRRYRVAGLQP